MYCEKCKTVFDGNGRCPDCNSKKTREVREDDICLVTERPLVLSGLLEEVFKNNQIPYMTKGRLGAGLTMTFGSFIETIRFYVPYPLLGKAQELVGDIFATTDHYIDDDEIYSEEDQDDDEDDDYYDDIDYEE